MIDEVKAPIGEPNGVKTEVPLLDGQSLRIEDKLWENIKKEAFSEFCGVYEECRIDGVFCGNAKQIPPTLNDVHVDLLQQVTINLRLPKLQGEVNGLQRDVVSNPEKFIYLINMWNAIDLSGLDKLNPYTCQCTKIFWIQLI